MSNNDNILETKNNESTEEKETLEVKDDAEVKEENSAEEIIETRDNIETNESNNVESEIIPICADCGNKLEPGQAFCPKCGKKVVSDVLNSNNKMDTSNSKKPDKDLLVTDNSAKNKKNTKIILIAVACAVALVVVGIIVFIFLRGTPVEKLTLSDNKITIDEDSFYALKCTISPSDATDKKLEWKSSDNSVAKVNNRVNNEGVIIASKPGNCSITVTASNGVTAKCDVTVEEAGPDLLAVYNELDDSYYCKVGSDRSYLEIDTNPLDIDDYSSSTATRLIVQANTSLGLPESVLTKMSKTNALAGTQTYQGDKISVSWTYHPDNGLEVVYESTK